MVVLADRANIRRVGATGASNHAVKSSVGRRGVGIKKVLKVAWIIETTSARTERVSNNA